MKSALISIKPKYCELIANGKKTIEVNKTEHRVCDCEGEKKLTRTPQKEVE